MPSVPQGIASQTLRALWRVRWWAAVLACCSCLEAGTLLLIQGEGSSTSTALEDSGPGRLPLQALGSARRSPAESRAGAGSVRLNGVNGDAVVLNYGPILLSGPFTFECWVRPDRVDWSQHLFNAKPGSGNGSYLKIDGDSKLVFGVGSAALTATVPQLAAYAWAHVALVRDQSGTVRVFVNGVASPNTITTADVVRIDNIGSYLHDDLSSQSVFIGYLDEVRVSNEARYAGAFTPGAGNGPSVALAYQSARDLAAPGSPAFSFTIRAVEYTDAYGATDRDRIWGYTLYKPRLGEPTQPTQAEGFNNDPMSLQFNFTESRQLMSGAYSYVLSLRADHSWAYDRVVEGHYEDEHDDPEDPEAVTGRHWVDAHREVGFEREFNKVISAGSIVFYVGDAMPVFLAHPEDATACFGTAAGFTAIAAGDVTYRWQTWSAARGEWSDIASGGQYSVANSGAGTELKAHVANTAMDGSLYRCVATNPAGSTGSTPAKLQVTMPAQAPGTGVSYVSPQQSGVPIQPAFSVAITGSTYTNANGETDADTITGYRVIAPDGTAWSYGLPWGPQGTAAFADPRGTMATPGTYTYRVEALANHPVPYQRWVEGHYEDDHDDSDDPDVSTGQHWVDAHWEVGFDTEQGYVLGTSMITFYIGTTNSPPSTAPMFLIQPKPAGAIVRTTPPYDTVTFTAAAISDVPPAYQWQRKAAGTMTWANLANGGGYSGVTTTALIVTVSTGAASGDQYRCLAINGAGTTTSDEVAITAYVPPVITSQPADQTVLEGQPVALSIDATANLEPVSFRWEGLSADGFWLQIGSTRNMVVDPVFIAEFFYGMRQFRCKVSNAAGTTQSRTATVTIERPVAAPGFYDHPQSLTVVGSVFGANFTVYASGYPVPALQWQFDATGFGGWTNLSDGTVGGLVFSGTRTPNLNVWGPSTGLNGAGFRCVASNTAGTATSNAAYLRVEALFGFYPHPQNQTVGVGQTAQFTAFAAGATWYEWERLVGTEWRPVGTAGGPGNYSGTFSSALTVSGVTAQMHEFKYRCLAQNGQKTIRSEVATLYVAQVPPAKPEITKGPESRTMAIGVSASFGVEATGSGLTYQWRRDGVAIPGATAAAYTISSVQASDSGAKFSVVVSNSAGSVTSNEALLTVLSVESSGLVRISDITSTSFKVTWLQEGNVPNHQVAVDGVWRSVKTASEFSDEVFGCSPGGSYNVEVRGMDGANNIVRYGAIRVVTRGEAGASAARTMMVAQLPAPPSRYMRVPRWVRSSANEPWQQVNDGYDDEVMPVGGGSANFRVTVTSIVWTLQRAFAPWDDYDFMMDLTPGDYDRDDLFDADGTWIADFGPSFGASYILTPSLIFATARFNGLHGYTYRFAEYDLGRPGQANDPTTWWPYVREINHFGSGLSEFDLGYLILSKETVLIKYGLAPGGCVMSLPGLGQVSAGTRGTVGTATVLGGVTVSAGSGTSATASVSFPSGGSVTINSTGQVTGTLPGGYSVSADVTNGQAVLTTPVGSVTIKTNPGEVTISAPSGLSITVGGNGIRSLTLPHGLRSTVGNVLDLAGIVLGAANGSGVRVRIGTGAWDPAGDIDLGALPIGDYDLGVTSDTRGIPEQQNVVTIRILVRPQRPRLAVDANRDGVISFEADGTTPLDPYRFWFNDDRDEVGLRLTDSSGYHEKGQDVIGYTLPPGFVVQSTSVSAARDLEDFTRLWVSTQGISSALKNGDLYLGLRWSNVVGSPAINVLRHVEADGGTGYLRNIATARLQTSDSYGKVFDARDSGVAWAARRRNVQGPEVFILPSAVFEQISEASSTAHLLFEGACMGRGLLTPVVLRKSNETYTTVGEGDGVWIDIMNIKSMYERALATTDGARSSNGIDYTMPLPSDFTGPDPNNIPRPTMGWEPYSMGFPYMPDPHETKNYFIFVHGWRWSPAMAINRAETVFKRLWHAGYRGRFAAIRWPTFYGGTDDGDDSTPILPPGLLTFNPSEYRAWKSAESLKQFVNQLPSGYTRYVVAHSMGNFVAGEALRSGMSVESYVMLNAATPAICYDERETLHEWGYATSNTDTDYGTKMLSYSGRFRTLNTTVINFYLPFDSATTTAWNTNNLMNKPHVFQPSNNGYQYRPTWAPGNRLAITFALSSNTRYLIEAHEAMAYACKSPTLTAGAEHRTGGPISDRLNMDAIFEFGTEHGAQWDRNIQDTGVYTFYRRLLEESGIVAP